MTSFCGVREITRAAVVGSRLRHAAGRFKPFARGGCKVGAAGAWEASSAARTLSAADQKINDAALALMALGFKQVEAHDAVRAAQAVLGAEAAVEQLVRAALKKGA